LLGGVGRERAAFSDGDGERECVDHSRNEKEERRMFGLLGGGTIHTIRGKGRKKRKDRGG